MRHRGGFRLTRVAVLLHRRDETKQLIASAGAVSHWRQRAGVTADRYIAPGLDLGAGVDGQRCIAFDRGGCLGRRDAGEPLGVGLSTGGGGKIGRCAVVGGILARRQPDIAIGEEDRVRANRDRLIGCQRGGRLGEGEGEAGIGRRFSCALDERICGGADADVTRFRLHHVAYSQRHPVGERGDQRRGNAGARQAAVAVHDRHVVGVGSLCGSHHNRILIGVGNQTVGMDGHAISQHHFRHSRQRGVSRPCCCRRHACRAPLGVESAVGARELLQELVLGPQFDLAEHVDHSVIANLRAGSCSREVFRCGAAGAGERRTAGICGGIVSRLLIRQRFKAGAVDPVVHADLGYRSGCVARRGKRTATGNEATAAGNGIGPVGVVSFSVE